MKILPKDPVKTLIVIAYIFVGVIFAVWILPSLVKRTMRTEIFNIIPKRMENQMGDFIRIGSI